MVAFVTAEPINRFEQLSLRPRIFQLFMAILWMNLLTTVGIYALDQATKMERR